MNKSTLSRTIGDRIRSERERLGLNQVDFGWAGSVKRGSQVGYEGGDRPPTAEYLAGIAAIGADVQYIVTGVRSQNISDVRNPSADNTQVSEPETVYGVVKSQSIDRILLAEIMIAVEDIVSSQVLSARWDTVTKANVVAILYKNYSAAKEKPRRDDPALAAMIEVLLGPAWG